MKRSPPVAPFLVADAESVAMEPWKIADAGRILGDRLEHWDPDVTLRLDRSFSVDMDRLLVSIGTGRSDDLAVGAVWRSGRTRLRGPGSTAALAGHHGRVSLTVSVDVPGRLAGGSLELQTAIVRTRDAREPAPLAARRAGSVLWNDRIVVALEGSAARFPLTPLDFATVPGLDRDAAWTLEWSPNELDQPVLGALRLLINMRNESVMAAITDADDTASLAIRSMIRFDIARSLVHAALGNDELTSGSREFEPDSIGRMLCELLERYWPGQDPASLARRAREAPHRLETELQSATALLAP